MTKIKETCLYILFGTILSCFLCLVMAFLLITKPIEADLKERIKNRNEAESVLQLQKMPENPVYVYYDIPLSQEMQEYIQILCRHYELDHKLVLAVIWHESNFEENAKSETNDYGLMQVNAIHMQVQDLTEKDLLDPYKNVKTGISLLSDAFQVTTDPEKALMVYHFGERGARKLWDDNKMTSAYSKAVLKCLDDLKKVN